MIDLDTKYKWIPKDLNKRPEWDKQAMEEALKYGPLFKMLLAMIKERVIVHRKHAGGGMFKKYQDARKPHFIYWVSPEQPQPATGIIARRKVGDQMWVGYASGREYKKAAHGSAHRNYVDHGDMWRSLRIRFRTSYDMRAAFYGSSKRAGLRISKQTEGRGKLSTARRSVRNADKSYYAEKNESYGLLWASDSEVDKVIAEWEKMYDTALGALIRMSDTSFRLKKQLGDIDRRVQRVQKKINKALKN